MFIHSKSFSNKAALYSSCYFSAIFPWQVDLSDPAQLDGRQLDFMQQKAKVRPGQEVAQPPQIFNKTYRGVGANSHTVIMAGLSRTSRTLSKQMEMGCWRSSWGSK